MQVGAGIASMLGRYLGLRPEKVKALIPVGAAAAIAAAFNTPLAAVVFALEEVVGDLHAPVLGSVVLASATSWGMLRLLLGNDPLFQVPQYQLVHPGELGIYALLGVLGGFISAAFTRLLLSMRAWFLKRPKKTVWFQPVAGRFDRRDDGLFCATNPWRGLQICRRRFEWRHGAEINVAAAGAQAFCSDHQLRLRKRRRNFRSKLVSRSHARRNRGNVGASLRARLRRDTRRLRTGGHGHSFRRNCASAR